MSTSLDFKPPIIINNEEIKNIDEYLNLILKTLNITNESVILAIKKPFEVYNAEAYRLLSNRDINDKISTLLKADEELNKLVIKDGELHEYYQGIEENWKKTMESLAKLQGLIIIRKTAKGCGPTINKLILALANKIDASNNLLELELEL